jgi:hypothetical protein
VCFFFNVFFYLPQFGFRADLRTVFFIFFLTRGFLVGSKKKRKKIERFFPRQPDAIQQYGTTKREIHETIDHSTPGHIFTKMILSKRRKLLNLEYFLLLLCAIHHLPEFIV